MYGFNEVNLKKALSGMVLPFQVSVHLYDYICYHKFIVHGLCEM